MARRGRLGGVLGTLAALFLAARPVGAQNVTPRLVAEGHAGHASFADNSPIGHSVFGGSARIFLTPRIAVGPEITYMRGPGADRDWFFTGNITVDVLDPRRRRRVAPYVIAGAGYTRQQAMVGTGLFSSGEGTFTAGAGARVDLTDRLTDRLFVAPELRLGWELHWRAGLSLGVKW
ncbi:MAG: hypothetical protein ABI652_04515 [Acidobacteriota bacterium]